MRALVILMLTCLPASAMTCGMVIQSGQWFAQKDLQPDLLAALVTREVEILTTTAKYQGLLLNAKSSPEKIILRLLTSAGKFKELQFETDLARSYPLVDVRSELPDLVAKADALHGERRLQFRTDVVGALTRAKLAPGRLIKLIYVESDNRTLRELRGEVELPELSEELAGNLTGQPRSLHVKTPDGTHSIDPRRVVRVYL